MAIKISGVTVISDTQQITSNTTASVTGNITGGNLLTAGIISATGNITGGNILGTIVGTVSTPTVSASGNITGGNLLTSGVVSATGNVTGNYILGNGALLTGVITSVANINSGNSNVTVTTANGNIAVSVGGIANVAVFASTGEYITGLASVSGNVTGGNLLTAGLASATGNITGGNLLTAGLVSATSTITSAANITGGNLLTAGLVSATGNITGGNVNTSALRPTSGALTISTVTGNLNLQPTTGNIVINSTYINGVTDPVANQDVATKNYVDTLVSSGVNYHSSVLVATTDTLANTTGGTITYTQPNGVSNGIGALLTTTGSFNLIDTANVQTVGTRILVKDQANAVQNGVYTWANATNIVRSTDSDEYGPNSAEQISLNDYYFVTSGNVNKGSAYVVNSPTGVITFGTSNITFAQFSSSQTYTANTSAGISINGTVINAKTDNITTSFDGTGNIVVKTSAALTTPNIGAATGTSLSTTGNITGGNILTGGLISATANITGGNLLTAGLISATSTVTSAANITGGNILTGGLISATSTVTSAANITGGNILTAGLISATGNITGGNVLGGANVNATTHTGTTVSVTANITGGNILTGGLISATSTVTSAANITGGNILTAGLISATGNITGGNVLGGANVNATTHTGTTVSVTGNITGGNLAVGTGTITGGNIVNSNANGIGNIGSSTTYFNTVFAKATSAQYADLAENYRADAAYEPGTVLDFDGSEEVTLSKHDSSRRVAGVVSTNPAHLMNSTLDGAHVAAVALCGRVPTHVIGQIAKGDMMVSAGNGRARSESNPATGTVIGKALENFNGDEGMIEIVISMQ